MIQTEAHGVTKPPRSLRVAIIANERARSVTPTVVRALRTIAGADRVYVSRSLDHLTLIARHIVAQRFDVVLCAGGDGTFARCVSALLGLGAGQLPAFGVIRLGTGNALADALGATARLAPLDETIRQARDAARVAELPLVRVGGRVAPFIGCGADAEILEDYAGVCRALRGTALGPIAEGPLGYALAVATRSVWKLLVQRRPTITIRNAGEPAYLMDREGRPGGPPVGRGELLYHGPAVLCAASTLPSYGFGFRLFPQAPAARGAGRFQLRVMNSRVLSVLLNLPAFCRGEYFDSDIKDYACTTVEIESDQPLPLQLGGDAAGRSSRLRLELTWVRGVWNRAAGATPPRAMAPAQKFPGETVTPIKEREAHFG
jgi:diacylglycerol kinase family enzyme